jgi:hypothetical protein
MRLRRPRFIVIVTCDLPIRAVAFDHHADHLFRWTTIELESDSGGTPTQAEHHRAIEAKYRRAARQPWLSAAPDPPASR